MNSVISKATKIGMAQARRRGIKLGRPSKRDAHRAILQLVVEGRLTESQAGGALGISESGVCHALRRYGMR
jgi:hypothetical protein